MLEVWGFLDVRRGRGESTRELEADIGTSQLGLGAKTRVVPSMFMTSLDVPDGGQVP